MTTGSTAGGGATPGPAAKQARDGQIASVLKIRTKLRDGTKETPPMSYQDRSRLGKEMDAVLARYFAGLPRFVFGRCPVCNALLEQVFDPWGLDGFWWEEDLAGDCPAPSACKHFRVLTGALSLNGHAPLGGEADAYPGPEVPFVIPLVLEMPSMVAVISSIAMGNGYTAHPISYFSTEPPPTNALAHPWTRTSCDFTAPDGASAFTYLTDPWDFELLPWVAKGKVQWIKPGDRQNALRSGVGEPFPYANLPGLREQQKIWQDRRTTTPPPNGEEIDPFNE